MRSRIASLPDELSPQLRASIGYAIGNAARAAGLLLLTPFLINRFTLEEYGIWVLSEILVVFLNMIMVAGADVALMRQYWSKEDQVDPNKLVGTVFIGISIIGIVLIACAFAVYPILEVRIYWLSPLILAFILLIAWLESLFSVPKAVLRIREKVGVFVSLAIARMILLFGLSLYLVEQGGGIEGGLLGRLYSTVIIVLLAMIYLIRKRWIHFNFDLINWKKIMRYGLPLLPTGLTTYILFASDRFFLERLGTLSAVAIYSFAYKISTSLEVFVIRPFSADWQPRRFKIYLEENAKSQYADILIYFLSISLAVGLLIFAATPLVYEFFAPAEYFVGMFLVPLLLLSYLVFGLSYPLNVGIMIMDKTRVLPIIGTIAALSSLLLNYILISRFGMLGAAIATLLSYMLWTGGIAIYSIRIFRIPYKFPEIFRSLVLAAIGAGGIILIWRFMATIDLFLVAGLSLVWVCLVIIVGFFLIIREKIFRPAGPTVLD